ncbi:helix-turn-helix domain-containing protein [Larkinella punicea]|uniref:AraC family transcriptional regulator n=1 Tax=Larkinella punicea TaxID=2315727 RepID=A0A368JHE3_9BACT|nr:AraC family transcriptional regulator [Larkinella punicea]RCR66962.1 AraC family transcriptional regulator [Larkinella punicea]
MNKPLIRVSSISQAHKMRELPPPLHPLISIVETSELKSTPNISAVLDFYMISVKRNCDTLAYGQQKYDFDGGVMSFVAPNQIISGQEHEPDNKPTGWILLVHPDFFWGTPLAKKIKKYDYFGYAVNEALFLSEKEESIIHAIGENIKLECNSNIDKFSHDIIISHLETFLNYAERFYQRQFLTRRITNHQLLDRLEKLLNDYFNSDDLAQKGLPTVQYISDNLNISSKYLGSMLKQLTGLTTQQHIHEKLIDKAKEKLSLTDQSVSDIAYELGFEHLQSFSKLFKAKTKRSPLEFRDSFN